MEGYESVELRTARWNIRWMLSGVRALDIFQKCERRHSDVMHVWKSAESRELRGSDEVDF
jgi:hypothetical protein